MKVSISAVPALTQPYWSISPWLKSKAKLLWPNIPLSIGGK
ncbi:hypothetical protein [Clostridium merdae]|nr:hypothetical protein [Clostridium merdae]